MASFSKVVETPASDNLRRKSMINNMGAHSIPTTPIRRSGINNQSSVADFMEPENDEDERSTRRSAVAMQKRFSNVRRKSMINNMGAHSIPTTPIRRSSINNQSSVADFMEPENDEDERSTRRSAVAMQKRFSNVRRKSMINNMGAQSILTTPIRRSGINNQSSVADFMEPENDEDERSTRRSAVAMQKRVSNIRSDGSPVVVLDRVISETEMKEHLQLCMKLFTENRITVKNAWELKIIEVLRQVVAKGLNNMFQVVNSSLDIVTKVYGIRVDDAHASALQLANRLAESSRKRRRQESDDEDQSEAVGGAKKKKQTVRKKKNTIDDKEGGSIFAPLTRLGGTTFSTKEDPSISTDNLFSSKLPMHPIGHRFCALTGEKVTMQPLDSSLFAEKVKVSLPKLLHRKFCPELRTFRLDEMDASEYLVDNSQNEVVFDDDGLPIAELDGSIHDIFENGSDDDAVSDVEEYQPEQMQVQIQSGIAHVVNALPEESRIEHEYGYNLLVQTASGKFVDKWWTGPFHWKLKYIKSSKPKFSGTEEIKHRQKRRRKVPVPIKFGADYVDTNDYEKDVLIGTRAPATVKPEKITLPYVGGLLNYFMKPRDELLLKPVVRPSARGAALPNTANQLEVSVYNYENPNDSNYCPQHKIDSDGGDNHDNDAEDNQVFSQENFAENLIDAPEMVPQAQFAYAHGKKMSMPKLKKSVWKVLTPGEQLEEETVTPTSFSNLYGELPKHLSSDMKKELSPHLAFVALLHLCNEKNLHLTQTNVYNFNIEQG